MVDDAEMRRRVNKMYTDFYEGKDVENPSLTTRVSLLEKSMEEIKTNLRKMNWLLLGILATAIVNIVVHGK